MGQNVSTVVSYGPLHHLQITIVTNDIVVLWSHDTLNAYTPHVQMISVLGLWQPLSVSMNNTVVTLCLQIDVCILGTYTLTT